MVNYKLFFPSCSLFIVHCSLFIVHCSLFIVHCSLFIALSTLFIVTGHAQSLDSLRSLATANNLELKVLENEYLSSLERAPQVGQLPDPEAGIGVFPFPVETRLGPQVFRLGATQMFPWFGTLSSKKKLEMAKSNAINEKIGARKLDIFYQVELAYYQLYDIDKSISIISENIAILDALQSLALSKVESGKASAADVLRVQLKIEELNQELKILETAKVGPLASINQLINRPLNTPLVIVDSLAFASLDFDKNALEEEIQINHPMLRMYQLQQEISRKAIDLNELNGKPSFGVGMDYIMVNKRSDLDPPGKWKGHRSAQGFCKNSFVPKSI